MPSVKAIIAGKLFPDLLDHYLARIGHKGQQADEPETPGSLIYLPSSLCFRYDTV